MRTSLLLFLLCCGTASLPLQAAPPSAPAPAPRAVTPAPHSRLGEMMGSLTRALQEASEQRTHPDKAHATSLDAAATKPPARRPATTLPPDATAQAAVP